MATETITLQIPEIIYQRLVNTARAQRRPIEEIIVHALQVGSPPEWDAALYLVTAMSKTGCANAILPTARSVSL
ncbi:hypothetical protein Cal7507_0075 [Calothrix sp. PCC 7507]|nr:hypothetical protein Cal7507_0075 [Calothrix sp. PCC 7507]